MTKEEEKQILTQAVETFGLKAQLAMLQEDCAELIAAVSHYNRGTTGALDNLIEAMADTYTSLDQITLAFDRDITPLKTWNLEILKARIIEFNIHGNN